ncbi:MAG: hypothetical protein DSZ06_01380 [Sulfurospirillum sp.]|nr:MAG: hypothetical protein DSZ06_01380 [Sulfurospirillum sp.]
MKKILKSITLLTPLVFLGCAETNKPKTTKATVEQVYDANNVPRVIVPPSMRHEVNNAWSKIANALKLDDKAKRSFGNLDILFRDVSEKIMANPLKTEPVFMVMQKDLNDVSW